MSSFKGFFQLQRSGDLLTKLRHDHQRMQTAPMDVFVAFDFFVTGYHMLDWVYPNDKARQRHEEKAEVLLQICSHIANGIKHFQATAKKHQSVDGVRVREAWAQAGMFQADMIQGEALVIRLDGQAALALGSEIECLDLASQVLQFWERHPEVK